jgi:hypothetical protein
MENFCEFVFTNEDRTGHVLRLIDWKIKIDGNSGECRDSAAKRNSVYRAHKTALQVVCALALFKEEGTVTFPSDEFPWRTFRENLTKAKSHVQTEGKDHWAVHFFGTPGTVIEKLFDLSDSSGVAMRTSTITRGNVRCLKRNADGSETPIEVAKQLESQLTGTGTKPPLRTKAIEFIEKDQKTRDLMQRTARETLGIAELGPVQELILGKALYFSRLLEAHAFMRTARSQLNGLRSELRLAKTTEDIVECFRRSCVLHHEAQSLSPFFGKSNQLQALADALAQLTDHLGDFMAKGGVSAGTGKERCGESIEDAAIQCGSSADLNVLIDACRQKLKQYAKGGFDV